MSERNNHDTKAKRRDERQAQANLQEYLAAIAFALQAARATKAVPIDTLERAIKYGDAQIQPGVPLDDLLEIETGQRALRATLKFRQEVEDIKGVQA